MTPRAQSNRFTVDLIVNYPALFQNRVQIQRANSGVRVWIEEKHEQFTRLLIQHEPELMRCILVAVPNRSDARDILQECSVALWRKFGNYDPERAFVAWA